MKHHIKKAAAVVAAILITITSAYAHSGRTDSSGGHYDRSTGEYHYHHGHPAHQHPNGVCPYKQNITPKPTAESQAEVTEIPVSPTPGTERKYNYSSGYSGSGTGGSSGYSRSSGKGSSSTNTLKATDILVIIISCLMFGWPIIFGVIGFIFNIISNIIKFIFNAIKAWKEKRRRAKLPPYIKPEIIIKRTYIKPEIIIKRAYIKPEIIIKKVYIKPDIKIKWGYVKPELTIKEAPERWKNIAIGEDRYPYDKTAEIGFDTQFTVFTTKSGKNYHRYNCSHLKNKSNIRRRHLYYVLQSGYSPCTRCKPPSTVDPWYLELFPEKTLLSKFMREDNPK